MESTLTWIDIMRNPAGPPDNVISVGGARLQVIYKCLLRLKRPKYFQIVTK